MTNEHHVRFPFRKDLSLRGKGTLVLTNDEHLFLYQHPTAEKVRGNFSDKLLGAGTELRLYDQDMNLVYLRKD